MKSSCQGYRRLMSLHWLFVLVLISLFHPRVQAQVMGDAVDVSQDFQKMEQVYLIGERVANFDPATGKGTLEWMRSLRRLSLSFNKLDRGFERAKSSDFPGTEYDENPKLPFEISFISPRTVRLRFATRSQPLGEAPSLMLVSAPPRDNSWKVESSDTAITYTGAYGKLRQVKSPWRRASP